MASSSLCIALATLLAATGCAQVHPPGDEDQLPGITATAADAPRATAGARVARTSSVAGLVDRGDLVVYPPQRTMRRDGAYTWHRTGLSEEHALHAIGGVMKVSAPDGQLLQFAYERHVEHPSGDWTWIGRARGAPSEELILTFGSHAVYGSIAQPGQAPLKLTTSGGATWLIETDRARLARIDNEVARPDEPDFRVPPRLDAGADPGPDPYPPLALSLPGHDGAAAAATVDVLLGYTAGFAAAHGGQPQALTRLTNMVEIANQAFANSQLGPRIRLVHALQVSYPDHTANLSTLEAMSGFRWPGTRITPDPAFAALRAAREQYGADLVSLVRVGHNDGCGLAWLVGGGLAGVRGSDEYFGYSVVSDGHVGTPGASYFCREETLAHELGHNLGSQHDQASSLWDGKLTYGAYAYSFGHKTFAGDGNFFTVMSYRDSGQTGYRIFSNPRSNFCGGAPCGVDNVADNARSLAQTMPIVATFRATVVPSEPEVNWELCELKLPAG